MKNNIEMGLKVIGSGKACTNWMPKLREKQNQTKYNGSLVHVDFC